MNEWTRLCQRSLLLLEFVKRAETFEEMVRRRRRKKSEEAKQNDLRKTSPAAQLRRHRRADWLGGRLIQDKQPIVLSSATQTNMGPASRAVQVEET